jgi:putative PIN family toxin of toxin-antitoxin system
MDCMIYLQAALSEGGASAALLRSVEAGHIVLLMSEEILTEVRDVLTRPALQRKFPRLTPNRAEMLVEFLRERSSVIDEVPSVFSYARDPKDEKYVNLAIAGNAAYLISRDKDLLDLRADEEFTRRFSDLKILDPAEALREMSPTLHKSEQ